MRRTWQHLLDDCSSVQVLQGVEHGLVLAGIVLQLERSQACRQRTVSPS